MAFDAPARFGLFLIAAGIAILGASFRIAWLAHSYRRRLENLLQLASLPLDPLELPAAAWGDLESGGWRRLSWEGSWFGQPVSGTLEAGGRGGGQRAEGQRAEVARREVQRAAGERGAVTEHQGTSGDSGIARIGRRRIELDGAEARLVQGVAAGDRARDRERGAGGRIDDGVRPEQNAAVGVQGERGRRG